MSTVVWDLLALFGLASAVVGVAAMVVFAVLDAEETANED